MKKIAALLSAALLTVTASAQGVGLWLNAGAEKQIVKGLDAEIGAEYRLSDKFSRTDRWGADFSISKRLYRNQAKNFSVKAAAGYKLTQVFETYSTKYKDNAIGIADDEDPQYYIQNMYDFNLTDSYKVLRHRFTASLQAGLELGRFKLSLRESYQYTIADSVGVPRTKYRYKNDKWSTTQDEVFKGKMNKQVLRSRISLDYNIPHWKYDPFVSYELFSDLNNGFATEKSRFTAGIEFTFSKKHNFEVAYIYQDKSDADEAGGSVISIGYTFQF